MVPQWFVTGFVMKSLSHCRKALSIDYHLITSKCQLRISDWFSTVPPWFVDTHSTLNLHQFGNRVDQFTHTNHIWPHDFLWTLTTTRQINTLARSENDSLRRHKIYCLMPSTFRGTNTISLHWRL